MLRLPLSIIEYLLAIEYSISLLLIAVLHVALELLCEFLDLDIVRLEDLMVLGEVS